MHESVWWVYRCLATKFWRKKEVNVTTHFALLVSEAETPGNILPGVVKN